MTESSGEILIEESRRLWVTATEESITEDILCARTVAKQVPLGRRANADEFVLALERLDLWLRDF